MQSWLQWSGNGGIREGGYTNTHVTHTENEKSVCVRNWKRERGGEGEGGSCWVGRGAGRVIVFSFTAFSTRAGLSPEIRFPIQFLCYLSVTVGNPIEAHPGPLVCGPSA